MPSYDFQCTACLHAEEQWLRMSDEFPTRCPICFGLTFFQVLSMPNLQFSGRDWPSKEIKLENLTRKAME